MVMNLVPPSWRLRFDQLRSLSAFLTSFAGRRGVLALIYITLGALFESIGLVLLIPLFSLVIGTGTGDDLLHRTMGAIFASVGVTTQFGRLSLMLGLFATLIVIRGVVISLRDTTVMGLQIEFINHLRSEVAMALAAAGWDRILSLQHARILNIMGADIQRISGASHFVLQAGIAFVILLSQCVLSFVLSPRLALFSFALLIVGGIAMIPMLRRARDLGQFVSTSHLTLTSMTTQFLNGLKMAFSQDLQGSFAAEYRETLNGLTVRQIAFLRQQTAGRVALTTLSALVGAAVILVGYGFLHLSAPLLIAFLLVIARMSGPAAQIQQGLQQIANSLPAYETVIRLLTELRAQAAPKATIERTLAPGSIVLEDVAFTHANSEPGNAHGVCDVSLAIEPGSFVGIAGPSGAGKTTLADLLVGLLQPQRGRILIGGTALDNTTLASWRAQLSYISQDPFLFHDTVRRNLKWAWPGASEADMWQALEMAGAAGIVRGLAGGLDAMVGERGSLVSGGERQRIALARALLRKPRLLIMDEATNAIDIAGERQLLERLGAMEPRPTIVMIAHRSESLAQCTQVLRVSEGRLLGEPPQSAD
ncbi:MAG: ABC transporter ATP-binding protein [Rhizomicrobium sp.]